MKNTPERLALARWLRSMRRTHIRRGDFWFYRGPTWLREDQIIEIEG